MSIVSPFDGHRHRLCIALSISAAFVGGPRGLGITKASQIQALYAEAYHRHKQEWQHLGTQGRLPK